VSRPAAALTLAAALLAGCAHPPATMPATPSPARLEPPPGWALAWADEFDGDGLPDPARWAHDTVRNKDGWYNHEAQYYGAAGSGNAVVRGGRLVITAKKESPRSTPDWGGQAYTSARLITRGLAEWTYGFVEVRAKMPCGKGTWPAIWMLGTGGRWPDDGEIDILEHMGKSPERVSSAVHTAAGSGGDCVGGNARLPTACTAFHNYQLLWTREGLSFGVDGVMHAHYPNRGDGPRAWPFDQPHFLILNLAIGGDLGGPVDDAALPRAMEVEHVRVWQAPRTAR
jgi:beta-glucanase (GH16 family)